MEKKPKIVYKGLDHAGDDEIPVSVMSFASNEIEKKLENED